MILNKSVLKKLALVFILAFVLNWMWEIAHSPLYSSYRGGVITLLLLFEAAFGDAVAILILVFIAQKFKLNKSLFVATGGIIAAVVVEVWALKTGRWTYGSLMPIVPIIKTGLTPTIQLAITGYIVQKLLFKKV